MAAEEPMELELETAAILCDLKRILRARDRRQRRRMRRVQQRQQPDGEIPSWGRRALRSVLVEDSNSKPGSGALVADRDGAASPDTPLVFPDSVPEEEDDDAKARKATAQDEWVLQQRGVVATLSQENVDLAKQIEECRARLLSSRNVNEQLHKVRQQEQQAHRRMRALLLRQGQGRTTIPNHPRPLAPPVGLDLNAPAEDAEEAAATAAARARFAAQERYWQLHKTAATAEARRRRREILRAKVVVSCRTRRVVG